MSQLSSSGCCKASVLVETLPSLAGVKPWFFKPKKSPFTVDKAAKESRKYQSSHWTEEENLRYVNFLSNFIDLMKSDVNLKRKYHLNRMMSKHVGSRSPIQCRSHHQKMLQTFKTPEGIAAHFLKKGENDTHPETIFEEFSEQLQPLVKIEAKNQSEVLKKATRTQEVAMKTVEEFTEIQLQDDIWEVYTYHSPKFDFFEED